MCRSKEYLPVYFSANVHTLSTVSVNRLNNPKREPHIRPLWLSKEPSTQVFCISCEVDTGASCNILPLYKAKALFGKNLVLHPPTVSLKGYNDAPVDNLGSCTVYIYHGDKTTKVQCEVADSKGHMILGRQQALQIQYVQFPDISAPAVTAEPETSVKTVTSDQEQHVSEPVRPDMQEITSSSITISGRTHQLPTTKGYLLKEFKDVFTGVGTLPGGPYHIQLKQDCKAVQHAPRQVAVSLKPEYQAELQRLTGLDVIVEVTEHTEWINSIVPVKKPDGSLRLCLDPKDLNKAIKRNQWYSRTIDDVLPDCDLAEARFMSLLPVRVSGTYL